VRELLRDLVAYALLHTVFVSALALLGETRADAYVAVSVLVYFVSSSLLPSIRKYSDLRAVDAALAALFCALVALRILDILGYGAFGAKP